MYEHGNNGFATPMNVVIASEVTNRPSKNAPKQNEPAKQKDE
jgi:hypothetical protein